MDKISKSFIKAKKEFSKVIKNKKNDWSKSSYAPLEECIDAVNEPLLNNGIAIIQKTYDCADGVKISTVFIHESGETISGGELFLPADKRNAQAFGSALTYARRYSLMAACGIAGEDDDGNAASKPKVDKTVENVQKKIQVTPTEQKQYVIKYYDHGAVKSQTFTDVNLFKNKYKQLFESYDSAEDLTRFKAINKKTIDEIKAGMSNDLKTKLKGVQNADS